MLEDIKVVAKIWYKKIKEAFARSNGLIVAAVTILAGVLVFMDLFVSLTVNVVPAPVPTPTPDYNASCKRRIDVLITSYKMKDTHLLIYDKPGIEGEPIGKVRSGQWISGERKYIEGDKLYIYINPPEDGWVHICTEDWDSGYVTGVHYKDGASG